jgi:UDP-N-acetylmuramate dehydrogenase
MKTVFNFDITSYNSFKINVKTSKFIEFEDSADYRLLKDKPSLFVEPIYILGGGYNTLFTKDYEGTILKISNKGLKVIEDNPQFKIIEVGAGENWNDLIEYCLYHNLYGIENLIDIPGNVGSAPIQNIGAYGVEVADVIESVNTNRISNGESISYKKEDCQFGYRTSIFKTQLKNKSIIRSVIFKFKKQGELKIEYGDIKSLLEKNNIINPNLRDVANAISSIRAAKLPDPKDIGNAGSFFKNPIITAEEHAQLQEKFPNIISYKAGEGFHKIAAGWLIENAGWKGRYMNGAAVHHQQALVLINANGKVKGNEVLELAQAIIQDIKEKFNIELETEVNMV